MVQEITAHELDSERFIEEQVRLNEDNTQSFFQAGSVTGRHLADRLQQAW